MPEIDFRALGTGSQVTKTSMFLALLSIWTLQAAPAFADRPNSDISTSTQHGPYAVRQTVTLQVKPDEACDRVLMTEILREGTVRFTDRICLAYIVPSGISPGELPPQSQPDTVKDMLLAVTSSEVIAPDELEQRLTSVSFPVLSPTDSPSDYEALRDPSADMVCYRRASHYQVCVQISDSYTGPLLDASW